MLRKKSGYTFYAYIRFTFCIKNSAAALFCAAALFVYLSFFETAFCGAVLFDVDTFKDYLASCDAKSYFCIEAYADIKCKQIGTFSKSVEKLCKPFEKLSCIASSASGLVCSNLSDEDCAADIEYSRSCC